MEKKVSPPIPETIEDVGYAVIGCELEAAGLSYEAEKRILVPYKEWKLDGHKIDLIVEGVVIVELKALPRLAEIHRLQVLSYLKATSLRLGYVINFNTEVLKNGTKRVVL